MKFTIGTKKEMTQIFDKDGIISPVTLIDISGTKFAGTRKADKDGYNAIILATGEKKRTTKSEREKYKELGAVPKKIVEFRVEKLEEGQEKGKEVEFEIEAGQKINVTAITKGKGFAGVIKRWGFSGGPKTHGQSDRHRAPGSIGAGTTPGRVFKGKKMPGRMGGKVQTVQNLKVVKFEKQAGLLYVKGAIPGSKGSYNLIRLVNGNSA